MSERSPRTRVKICGLTNPTDLQVAVRAGADAVGVITDVPVDTPREVRPEEASELMDQVPPFVTGVLVTMPESLAAARELVETVQPDILQIYGAFDPEAVRTLAREIPVVHAFDVGNIGGMRAVEQAVDGILIDSTDDAGAGGTGRTHDWGLARTRVQSLDVPVILAGGLTPQNVEAAIDRVGPFAVDVASGVEGTDGKDHEKISAFVRTAKAAGGD